MLFLRDDVRILSYYEWLDANYTFAEDNEYYKEYFEYYKEELKRWS